jgi:hypothetical protein
MRCLVTPKTIRMLTGAILTFNAASDGDHSLSSNPGFLRVVRSLCGLCAVLCGAVRSCAVFPLPSQIGTTRQQLTQSSCRTTSVLLVNLHPC